MSILHKTSYGWFFFLILVNGADGQSVAEVTDGPVAASSKRASWLASWFGSSKTSSASNSSQESEAEMSETDGTKKEEPAKKEEHITVPEKGTEYDKSQKFVCAWWDCLPEGVSDTYIRTWT